MVSFSPSIIDTPHQMIDSFPSVDNLPKILENGVLFFTGYAGSGKGTQGKQLAEKYHIIHLSTGELFRAEAESGSEIGKQMDAYMKAGAIIPKELVFSYLERELAKPDYRRGFIIDGYPKSIEFYSHLMETLTKVGLKPLAAIHFDLSKEAAVGRLTGRLHCANCKRDFHVRYLRPKKEGKCDDCTTPLETRSDDTEAAIERRLNVFDRETRPVVAEFQKNGLLSIVDASRPPEDVQNEIIHIISSVGARLLQSSSSYFLRAPKDKEKSSVFHGHIDAQSYPILHEIIRRIEAVSLEFQNKIYPVAYLQLGPQLQSPSFDSVYGNLPNFHSISEAADEAFSTHKMGDSGFDYAQVRATLEAAFAFPGLGVMTELEEEIYVAEVDQEGNITVAMDRGLTSDSIDWIQLPGWQEKMIGKIPPFELHHALDIPKAAGEEAPPINLAILTQRTTEEGLETGGWFVFRKKGVWAYRSNEFSRDSYENNLQKLHQQAFRLRSLVEELLPATSFSSGYSLEKVHAIWRVS